MQAIAVWNTVYIDRAVQELRKHRNIDDVLLSHTSPLGWGHIILTGDYDWGADKQFKPGEFRALQAVAPHQPVPSESNSGGQSGDGDRADASETTDVDA